MAVQAPAGLLLVPGTYRLTVKNPAAGLEGTFVVASPSGRAAASGSSGASAPPSGQEPAGAPTASETTVVAVPTNPGIPNGPAPLAVIEDSSAPYRTAIGYAALYFNTTGLANTASGYAALYQNTTGSDNTATGAWALFSNTTGWENTASGGLALYSNTTGEYNTAGGYQALFSNSTGRYNTASGHEALFSNTTGASNTAGGALALRVEDRDAVAHLPRRDHEEAAQLSAAQHPQPGRRQDRRHGAASSRILATMRRRPAR